MDVNTAREVLFEGVKDAAGKIIGALLLLMVLSLFPGLRALFKRVKNLKAGEQDDSDSGVRKRIHERQSRSHYAAFVFLVLIAAVLWALPNLMALIKGSNPEPEIPIKHEEPTPDNFLLTKDNVKPAVETADAKSLYELGRKYYLSEDYERAAYYYRQAAELGLADAQFDLASMYTFGPGEERDSDEAMKLFYRAAEQGHLTAQFTLGSICYYNEDYPEALEWYTLAAENGHTQAQFNLGNMYYRGKGVDQDYYEALKWYREAASRDHPEAEGKVREIEALIRRQ